MTRTMMTWCSLLGIAASLSVAACAADDTGEPTPTDDQGGITDDELRVRGTAHWFYSGPLPALESASVTISLAGHTARVTGYLPAGVEVPELPHVRQTQVGERTVLDVVYPVATAARYANNASVGNYKFERAIPYRPDGNTYTNSQGNHWVTWGGFPFLAYAGTIAVHGPITADVAKARSDQSVWFLKRGTVSSGCNRMMGEHVIELAHLVGVSMRKVYGNKETFWPRNGAPVKLIADYDKIDGAWIDVDFPTDTGAVRPAKAKPGEPVAMFGSWVGAELADGSDLPRDLKWQGGESGKWYVFKDHASYDRVCSVLPADLGRLATHAAGLPKKELPADFCAKKDCILDSLANGRNANACEAVQLGPQN